MSKKYVPPGLRGTSDARKIEDDDGFRGGRGDRRRDFDDDKRGGRGGYGDRRGDYGDRRGGDFGRRDGPRRDGPLPSGPRASAGALPSGPRASQAAAPANPIEEGLLRSTPVVVPVKTEQKMTEKERVEMEKKAAIKRKEEAALAKKAQEQAEKAAAKEAINNMESASTVTFEAIATGKLGEELTAEINDKLAGKPYAIAGVVLGTLKSISDFSAETKWWDKAHFGHALSQYNQSIKEQIGIMNAIQTFCHEKDFPKFTYKGKEKKLIEHLLSIFIIANILDAEGVVAWADDENKADLPGRMNAVIHLSSALNTLRESLIDEESEAEDMSD